MSLVPAQGSCLVNGSFCLLGLLAQETSSWFLRSTGNNRGVFSPSAVQCFHRTCDLHFSPFPCTSSNTYILEPLSLFEIVTLCADSVNLPRILLQCAVFPQCLSCETKPRQPPWQRSSVVPRTVAPVSYKDPVCFRQLLAHQFANWQQ